MGRKRAYCPYCDVFLVHNSLRSRRDHLVGWKHRASLQAYYARFLSSNLKQGNSNQDEGESSTVTYERKAPTLQPTNFASGSTLPISQIKTTSIVPPPTIPQGPPKIAAPPTVPQMAGPPRLGPPSLSSPNVTPSISGPPRLAPPSIGPPKIGPPTIGPPKIGPPKIGPPTIGPPKIGPPTIGPPKIGAASPKS
ncbi:U1 zinc finger family protein [Histomonas meleagridis]|uniref:U1 zinc finger family protein n=1 Tax=Histomonas meleagridis TaxID=135588 RepID=UPI00355A0CF4|nr:U1 zinc finger family protein [Histomonas meleagridis]KAH0798497.1 U1 zinc finger family protein [Histomonas meleagridis]